MRLSADRNRDDPQSSAAPVIPELLVHAGTMPCVFVYIAYDQLSILNKPMR